MSTTFLQKNTGDKMSDKQVALRIPEEQHIALKQISKTEDTTVSRIIRALIREYLNSRK